MKDGFLLLNKEKGYSSRDYIFKVAKKLGIRKFGHIGTLDPFATGMLIAAFGRATKLVPLFEHEDKTYVAELKLGEKTNTGDLTGEVIETKEVEDLDFSKIEHIIASFKGRITQIPPKYSAIKVNGKPLYHYAIHDIDVAIKSREVIIHSIELVSFEDNIIKFKCNVSSGTYIRTLGEDIAAKLNTVGHLISLERLSVGDFVLDNSYTFENVTEESLISLEEIIKIRGEIKEIDETLYRKIVNGNEIKVSDTKSLYLGIKYKGEMIALYKRKDNDIYKCERGLL